MSDPAALTAAVCVGLHGHSEDAREGDPTHLEWLIGNVAANYLHDTAASWSLTIPDDLDEGLSDDRGGIMNLDEEIRQNASVIRSITASLQRAEERRAWLLHKLGEEITGTEPSKPVSVDAANVVRLKPAARLRLVSGRNGGDAA